MVGLSVDAALEVVEVPPETVVGGVGGASALVAGEAAVRGQVVRVLDLAALGAGVAR
jgi:chemotaxis signal transduction protein